MSTPIKSKSHGVLNERVVNTPQPQATSTVRKKSTLESRFDGKSHSGGEKGGQGLSYENEPPQREDTSLDLLENKSDSNIDANLESVIKLFNSTDIMDSFITMDTNKENNVNVQNITANMSVPNFDFPIKTELNKENYMDNSISKVSVAFEPNEITARSSGVSISAKRQSPVNKASHGINLSKDDIAAQFNNETAKINDEKFPSGSKVAEQLSIDDRWRHDHILFIPLSHRKKQKTDFDSLSGITGEVDLSIESSAGRKVSVGQYLERKSGNIGILGNNEKVKPNLGVISETPIKTGNLAALVESTTLDAELTDNDRTLILNERDVNSETQRLADQPLKEQKKKNPVIQDKLYNPKVRLKALFGSKKTKKKKIIQDDERKETYTLPCNKESMMPTTNSNKFDEDINLEKLSADSNKDIVLVNAENLCTCIVGMTNGVNVQLINNGDRWITCTLKLIKVRGDTKSIELNIPPEEILLVPHGIRSTKIEVKVIKMCKPIFVTVNIFLSDMITKSKWSMKHMIFVNPEELELDIICHSDKQELDFQYIAEETKVLPITFYNRNNVDVPIKLSILHDGPKLFSVDGPTHLILRPKKKFATNIKYEKLRFTSIDWPQKQLQSKLIIHVQCKDNTILLRKKVPLHAQLGTYEIQITDREIYIVAPRQHAKLLNIINTGNVATHVSAAVEGQDFFIKPDKIFLQVGEQSSFLILYKPQFLDATSVNNERYAKIKLVAGNYIYHYIISIDRIRSSAS